MIIKRRTIMYEITDTPTYHGKPVIVAMNEDEQLGIMPRRMSGLMMSISNIHHSVFVPDSYTSKTEKNVMNTIFVLITSFVLFIAVGISTMNTAAACLSALIPTLFMVLLFSANKIVDRKITKIDKIDKYDTVMDDEKLVKALRYNSPEVSELIDIMKDADSFNIKYHAACALLSYVDIVDNNDRLFSKNGLDIQSTLNRIKEIKENAKSVVEIQDQAEHEIRKLSKGI